MLLPGKLHRKIHEAPGTEVSMKEPLLFYTYLKHNDWTLDSPLKSKPEFGISQPAIYKCVQYPNKIITTNTSKTKKC